MKKLIPMADFVLEQKDNIDISNYFISTVNYAFFLKQPLTIGMFIPCDLEGNVLEEPKTIKDITESTTSLEANQIVQYAHEYQHAKERVLFKGFKYCGEYRIKGKCNVVANGKTIIGVGFINGKHQTIEDLVKYNLELSETAIKQIS